MSWKVHELHMNSCLALLLILLTLTLALGLWLLAYAGASTAFVADLENAGPPDVHDLVKNYSYIQ